MKIFNTRFDYFATNHIEHFRNNLNGWDFTSPENEKYVSDIIDNFTLTKTILNEKPEKILLEEFSKEECICFKNRFIEHDFRTISLNPFDDPDDMYSLHNVKYSDDFKNSYLEFRINSYNYNIDKIFKEYLQVYKNVSEVITELNKKTETLNLEILKVLKKEKQKRENGLTNPKEFVDMLNKKIEEIGER